MRSKPDLDPEFMSCTKSRRSKLAPRWIGGFVILGTLGVLGVVAQAERQRSVPRMIPMQSHAGQLKQVAPGTLSPMQNRSFQLKQVAPGNLRQVPLLPPADRSIKLAPRGIDEAMIKTAPEGIDESMIVNPLQAQQSPVQFVPVPVPGAPEIAPFNPWQPSPEVPQPRR